MPWALLPTTDIPGPPPPVYMSRSVYMPGTPLVKGNSRYKFVITDMTGNVRGEVLDCSNKEFIQNLDNTQNAKFTVKLTNPMADYILNNDCLCKCYRQPINRNYPYRLLLVGDVLTAEEDTTNESGTITFTVADPLNRLMFRMLGKSVDINNHGLGWGDATALHQKDVMDIIGDMLLEVNGDVPGGHTGVILGARVPFTTGVNTYIDPVFFQPFATQLAIYTAAIGGFDFWMEPLEPHRLGSVYPPPGFDPDELTPATTPRDTVIARLNIYNPVGNYQRSDGSFSKNHPFPVFEYGVGKKNVQAYVRVRDKSQLTNRWYNLATGFPTSNANADKLIVSNPATVINPATGYNVGNSIRDRTLYEAVAPGDLGAGSTKLRQALVNSTAQVTAVARQQITFTPTINCDVDWTVDYFVGDVVTVRAYIPETRSWRFDGTVRIYGVDATIDDDEQEQIQITTIPTN